MAGSRPVFFCPKCKKPHAWRAKSVGKARACECGEEIPVPAIPEQGSSNATVAGQATRMGSMAGGSIAGGSIAGGLGSTRIGPAFNPDKERIRRELRKLAEETDPSKPKLQPQPRRRTVAPTPGVNGQPVQDLPSKSTGQNVAPAGQNKVIYQPASVPANPRPQPQPQPKSPAESATAATTQEKPLDASVLEVAKPGAASGLAESAVKALLAQDPRGQKIAKQESSDSASRDWVVPILYILVGAGFAAFELHRHQPGGPAPVFLGRGLQIYLGASALAVVLGVWRMLLGASFARVVARILKVIAIAVLMPAVWAGIIEVFYLLHLGGQVRPYVAMSVGAVIELLAFHAIFAPLFNLKRVQQLVNVVGITLIKLALFVVGFIAFNLSVADVTSNVARRPVARIGGPVAPDLDADGGAPQTPAAGQPAVAQPAAAPGGNVADTAGPDKVATPSIPGLPGDVIPDPIAAPSRVDSSSPPARPAPAVPNDLKVQPPSATPDRDRAPADRAWPIAGFNNDVLPVLTAAGCNSGACHAKPGFDNGLALSLYGFDKDADWRAITRQAHGRRINYADPARSLLLLKATGVLPHAGGRSFAVGSPEFAVIAQWIAEGAPGPQLRDPVVESLEVNPKSISLALNATVSLAVIARFSDGRTMDVTARSRLTSRASAIALMSGQNTAIASGRGQTDVVACYQAAFATARIIVPYEQYPGSLSSAPRRNFIDDAVLDELKKINLAPCGRSDDGEFVRRVFLTVIGLLPTPEEVRDFRANSAPHKRDALIESLFKRPEYVDYWSRQWLNWLRAGGQPIGPEQARALHAWLRQEIAGNAPWNEISRQILTASGNPDSCGPAAFYLLHPGAQQISAAISRCLLAKSIACARCHNHPFDDLTRDQYQAMADVFSHVRLKKEGVIEEIAAPSAGGRGSELPWGLNLSAEIAGPGTPRARLASELASEPRHLLARALASRIWAQLMGVGLADQDEITAGDPPANERLLSELSRYLAEERWDAQSLMRAILRSETFQRSSGMTPSAPVSSANAADERSYARYPRKLLPAEVLLDAFSQLSGQAVHFNDYRPGTRAMQLSENLADIDLLRLRTQMPRPSGCERVDPATATLPPFAIKPAAIRQLFMMPGGKTDRLASEPSRKIVEEIYLSALARDPSADEVERGIKLLESGPAGDRRALTEQLCWSVLSSEEFLHNH